MGKRRRFTQEFKLEAVRLLEGGARPPAEIARDLGVPRNRLYKWQEQVKKKGAAAFPGEGRGRNNDEVVQLRRELERVKEERDILKKAAAYFAKELK